MNGLDRVREAVRIARGDLTGDEVVAALRRVRTVTATCAIEGTLGSGYSCSCGAGRWATSYAWACHATEHLRGVTICTEAPEAPSVCGDRWTWEGRTHRCGRRHNHVTDHKCVDCGAKWG